jgi:uncharacterized membrane protein (DUF485 family)
VQWYQNSFCYLSAEHPNSRKLRIPLAFGALAQKRSKFTQERSFYAFNLLTLYLNLAAFNRGSIIYKNSSLYMEKS